MLAARTFAVASDVWGRRRRCRCLGAHSCEVTTCRRRCAGIGWQESGEAACQVRGSTRIVDACRDYDITRRNPAATMQDVPVSCGRTGTLHARRGPLLATCCCHPRRPRARRSEAHACVAAPAPQSLGQVARGNCVARTERGVSCLGRVDSQPACNEVLPLRHPASPPRTARSASRVAFLVGETSTRPSKTARALALSCCVNGCKAGGGGGGW